MPISWKVEKSWRRMTPAPIAGVDESGRGPWAGPVVACAIILAERFPLKYINDSKKLNETQRQDAFQRLVEHPGVCFAIGEASVEEIDRLNILRATFLAMERAVEGLKIRPDVVLVDGRDFPFFMRQGEAIIDGDTKVASIAAASILAKQTRDATMHKISHEYPSYGFSGHKGYGTAEHQAALLQYGPCPHHRRSFAPVRAALSGMEVATTGTTASILESTLKPESRPESVL